MTDSTSCSALARTTVVEGAGGGTVRASTTVSTVFATATGAEMTPEVIFSI